MSSPIQFLPPQRPSRETVLCLHASATSARSWRRLLAPLDQDFELLVPERLGCAEGECWPVGAPAPLDAEARHLAPLLNSRPHGVHLVGHSFGAAVALQIALRWPSRVRSLTLYEPSRFALLFGAADTVEAGNEILQFGRGVGFAVLSGRVREAAANFVDYWSGAGAWHALDLRRQQAIVRQMPKVQAEFEAAFADRVPMAAFRALTMPMRLIRGDASPLPSRQIVARLATLPISTTKVLAGVGHMGPLTDAARVLDALPAWLQPTRQMLAA